MSQFFYLSINLIFLNKFYILPSPILNIDKNNNFNRVLSRSDIETVPECYYYYLIFNTQFTQYDMSTVFITRFRLHFCNNCFNVHNSMVLTIGRSNPIVDLFACVVNLGIY